MVESSLLSEALYSSYVQDLLAGRKAACRSRVLELLENGIPVKQLYLGLFQRSMYEVGRLWEEHRISVAQEHIATAITESLLPLAYPKVFAAPRINRRAIVSCAANEYHQLGAKMVADIMEMHGWDAQFIGANTPVKGLLASISDFKPDLLCLSLSVYLHLACLLRMLRELRQHHKDLPVFVGGQAFLYGGIEALLEFPDVEYVASLDQLERRIA